MNYNKELILIGFIVLISIFTSSSVLSDEDNQTTNGTMSVNETFPEIDFSTLNLTNRTMYSDIYFDNSGDYEYYIARMEIAPINYNNGSEYIPINLTIVDLGSSGNFKYGVEKGIYKVYFKQESSTLSNNPFKLNKDGYEIIMNPKSLAFTDQTPNEKDTSTAFIFNNTLIYENQFKNISLRYRYQNDRLKEDLVIDNIEEIHQIKQNPLLTDNLILTFNLRSYNISSNQSMNIKINHTTINPYNLSEMNVSGQIFFLDEANNTNNSVYYISKPFAYDSNRYRINLDYSISSDEYGTFIIKIYTPYSWLNNSNITYPIYIDPTITTGRWGQLELEEDGGDFNYDNHDLSRIGSSQNNNGDGSIREAWTLFDVSGIENDAVIESVVLRYYVTRVEDDDCNDNEVDLEFYKLNAQNFQNFNPQDLDDNQDLLEDIYDAIGEDYQYGTNDHREGDRNNWFGEGLDEEGNGELQSLVDGNPTPWFTVGLRLEPSDEDFDLDECNIYLEDEEADRLPKIEISYIVPCDNNNDCNQSQYCDDNQRCVQDLNNNAFCNGITYINTNPQEDGACTSGYCDSDDQGLDDDGRCFVPYQTYFDGNENNKCEYSTDQGTINADERSVGEITNICSAVGENYFVDNVTIVCGLVDYTSKFECTDVGCSCTTPQCDGKNQQQNITYCNKGGQTYFQDDCGTTATAEDTDNICRSSGALNGADGCTADIQCNGVEAGTGNCDNSCNYNLYHDFPQNVYVYLNDTLIWNQSGYLSETKTIDDFSQELNNFLQDCVADQEGYCDIPIVIHSNTSGRINVTNIDVNFNITEYIWNTYELDNLEAYRLRIMASDGILNSTWNESQDFTIQNQQQGINKFFIQNISGSNVASLGDGGNIILKGSCISGGACVAPANSFIIYNSNGETVSYIDPNGNLCIETGDCTDNSPSCNPNNDAFIIKDNNNVNKIFIDNSGDLCLTGTLTQGGNP